MIQIIMHSVNQNKTNRTGVYQAQDIGQQADT